jgi:ribosomal protein S18 acetylase RimI-like enzyme
MASGRKPLQHQLNAPIRPARESDLSRLAARGIAPKPGSSIFVSERDGDIVGMLSFVDRPFESDVLGCRTMHLDQIAASDEDLQPLTARSLELLSQDGCQLVTVRRPETDRNSISVLQQAGFRVIECLITLSRSLAPTTFDVPADLSVARREDAEGCAEVARAAFRSDRFHADPAISDGAADELKAQWARNSVAGRADKVFVTRDGSTVTGFNACLLKGRDAVIDLIGVAPLHQGKGLGKALILAAIAHYSGKADTMTVGTQSCNFASLALYQDAGFRISSSALTMHVHLS